MYLTLAAIALGAAVVGLIYAAISAQTDEKLRPAADSRLYWSLLIWTAVLGLVLFAATWPSHPPFAAGLTLGWGFLIGLLVGLYATVEARRSFADGQWLVRSAGLLATAVAGPALVLIIFGAASADALIGCALGGVLVAAIWRSALAPMELRQDEGGDESLRYRSVELFALLNCALVAGTWLALEKYPATSGALAGVYWALAVLLAAVVVVATVIAAGFVSSAEDASRYRRPLAIGLAVSLVLIVATVLINTKLLGGGLAGTVVVLGIFGFVLISWLAVTAPRDDEVFGGYVGQTLVIALVALALGAVSFKLLQGFGESLALIGGIAIVALVVMGMRSKSGQIPSGLVTGGFTIVLLLAMQRIFLEQNEPVMALGLNRHYTYFTLILGVTAGLALLAYVQRNCQLGRDAPDRFAALATLMQRTALLGVLVAASPLILLVVWGLNAVTGFLTGLLAFEVVWLVLLGFVSASKRRILEAAAPHLYLLAAFLVAIQLSKVVLPLAEGPRLHRGIMLAVVVVIGVLWAVICMLKSARQSQGGGEVD